MWFFFLNCIVSRQILPPADILSFVHFARNVAILFRLPRTTDNIRIPIKKTFFFAFRRMLSVSQDVQKSSNCILLFYVWLKSWVYLYYFKSSYLPLHSALNSDKKKAQFKKKIYYFFFFIFENPINSAWNMTTFFQRKYVLTYSYFSFPIIEYYDWICIGAHSELNLIK